MFLCMLVGLMANKVLAQSPDSLPYRHFVGSTMFMLANLAPDPPSYYQLNYGYRVTSRDVVSLEFITWTYKGPLGRQYGPNYGNPESDYPGKVRSVGAGLAYKRFLWRRLYTQVHATALRQRYLDEEGDLIQKGFQLFCTLRVGYQFRFWKQRLFLEPSVAITTWPINTNLPDAFQEEEDNWPRYFLAEPGLHFGFNF